MNLKTILKSKRTQFVLLYYTIMSFVIFLPTIVFSVLLSFFRIFISFPALSLLIMEVIFIVILGHPRLLDKWERRFNLRKGFWTCILMVSLLSPMIIQIFEMYLPSNCNRSEIYMVTYYDTYEFYTYPQEVQQQLLDTASNFPLDTFLFSGSLTEYLTETIENDSLSTESYPPFIEVRIYHLNYEARITVVQTNFTLNIIPVSYDWSFNSEEEPSISWKLYETGAYWFNPGLNISLELESSINITAPAFFCEFNIYYKQGPYIGGRRDIWQKALLDSEGHILIITRECQWIILI